MTVTDHALHQAALTTSPASHLGRHAAWLARSFARRMIAYQTRRALGRLSDDLLRDVGLTRGEIDFVANELAEKSADAWRSRPR
jgi:uncharacterized protein YjiS (DUF1127 family)